MDTASRYKFRRKWTGDVTWGHALDKAAIPQDVIAGSEYRVVRCGYPHLEAPVPKPISTLSSSSVIARHKNNQYPILTQA